MLQEIISQRQIIQPTVLKRPQSIGGAANDWLLMQIETRIDKAGDTRQLQVFMQNLVVAGVARLLDDLWPGRAVYMNDSRTMLLHPAGTVKGNRHELRRVPGAVQVVVAPIGKLGQSHWGKRHEFGALETLIQPIIDTGIGRPTQDRTVPQRPGTILHAAVESRHHIPFRQELGDGCFYVRQPLRVQTRMRDRSLDLSIVEAGTEKHVCQLRRNDLTT